MTRESPSGATSEIVVYWRPGCMFCSSLRRRLDKQKVPHVLVNIWDDPNGAATVRSLAGGNETVPTVTVGPAAMVNPSLQQILAAASTHAPSAVPEGYEAPQLRGLAKLISKFLTRGQADS